MAMFFEDFACGETYELGSRAVTEEEIVEFARQYDPLPFHTDPDAAEESMFGGLIASGLHTISITFRLMGDVFSAESFMGARGWNDVRFLAPVRPGDTLSVHAEVTGKRVPDHPPERGDVDLRITTVNGEGTTVLSFVDLVMIRRRDA